MNNKILGFLAVGLMAGSMAATAQVTFEYTGGTMTGDITTINSTTYNTMSVVPVTAQFTASFTETNGVLTALAINGPYISIAETGSSLIPGLASNQAYLGEGGTWVDPPTAGAVSAPKIDSAGWASMLTLFGGVLLVARGRTRLHEQARLKAVNAVLAPRTCGGCDTPLLMHDIGEVCQNCRGV